MLSVEEADRLTLDLAMKAARGRDAVAAMKWFANLTTPEQLEHFKLSTNWASSCPGYKEAMAYVNAALQRALDDILIEARDHAQHDMDKLAE